MHVQVIVWCLWVIVWLSCGDRVVIVLICNACPGDRVVFVGDSVVIVLFCNACSRAHVVIMVIGGGHDA